MSTNNPGPFDGDPYGDRYGREGYDGGRYDAGWSGPRYGAGQAGQPIDPSQVHEGYVPGGRSVYDGGRGGSVGRLPRQARGLGRRGGRSSAAGGWAASARPTVTYALIAACVLVYLGQLASQWVTETFVDANVLVASQPWRLLTAAFLHSTQGVISMHLIMNMLSLWFLGRVLEPALGHWRFFMLYVAGAVGGSLCQLILGDAGSVSLGASGAIFAVGGGLLVLVRKDRQTWTSLAIVLGINFVYGFVNPTIAWQAHLGGLVVGALVAALFLAARRSRSSTLINTTTWLVLMAVMVGVSMYLSAGEVRGIYG